MAVWVGVPIDEEEEKEEEKATAITEVGEAISPWILGATH